MLISELERYDLLQVFGNSGTFGFYRRRRDERVVAVKGFVTGEGGQKGREEAKILATLATNEAHNHHIVRLYEAVPNGHFYIVQEALELNLVDFRNTYGVNTFQICDIRTIVLQVLRALARLKEVGIVHSRISLENIMLVDHASQPFQVKLMGFGAALAERELVYKVMTTTQSSSVSAPEEMLGCTCSRKIDMWALGCMAAEMALGRPLFPSDHDLELAHSIFGTRGLPPAAMLDSGRKTELLFDRVAPGKGTIGWRLKPNRKPVIDRIRSWREHGPAKLKDVESKNQLERGSKGQRLAELEDRRCLGHLLSRLLAVDPEERTDPDRALHHPFFTLVHLRQHAAYEEYCNLSLQAYGDAGVSVPQDLPSVSGESSEEIIPERRRPSVRQRLCSSFARVFKLASSARGNERPLEPSSSAVSAENLSPSATSPATQSTVSDEQESVDIEGQHSSEAATCRGSVDEPQTGSISSTEEGPVEPPTRRAGFLRRWIQTVWSRKSAATQDSLSQ